jgi:hypothetical protein
VTRHHWYCGYPWHGCDCGVSGPRHWRMDHLPADRELTPEEMFEWRLVIRGKDVPGKAHDELELAHAALEAGE